MARAPAILGMIAGLVVFATACPPESRAQPYSPLAVPDSSLVAAIRANRANFENHWNALLVSSLRATLASADSALRLKRLARRVAEAEPVALGSRNVHDALAREGRWSTAQRRLRITAAVRESLGAVARAEENWGRAEQLYRESLGLYRRLGEIRREAWVLGSLGVVALSAGNSEQALHVYAEALAARRALGDPRLLGNTLGDLGQVMFQLERYPEAYGYLRESAEVRETSGQLSALGGVLGFLASTLVALGARDSAELCVRRSLELTSSAVS